MTRRATAAHPLCTCREHKHDDGLCIGAGLVYERADGSRYDGECRILPGTVVPAAVDRCPMHGVAQ